MTWEKAKDALIVTLLGIAIRVFSSNMNEINKSVQDLNLKVGLVIQQSAMHDRDIELLKGEVKDLQIKKR